MIDLDTATAVSRSFYFGAWGTLPSARGAATFPSFYFASLVKGRSFLLFYFAALVKFRDGCWVFDAGSEKIGAGSRKVGAGR